MPLWFTLLYSQNAIHKPQVPFTTFSESDRKKACIIVVLIKHSRKRKIRVMKNRNILITLLILLPFFSIGQMALDNSAELINQKGDLLLEQAINFKEHVGITAAIYGSNKVIWTGGAGYRDEAQKETAKGMIHRIASISKPMTAVAVFQLAEQGKLDLDVPIQQYVSEFPKSPKGEITTRQLLAHTSGVRHYKGFWDGFSFKQFSSLTKAMKRFQKRDLGFEPGKGFEYTTYGYVVLGVIIERISGMSYDQYMEKNIWEPAGMKHTSLENKKNKPANKSKLYQIKKDKLKKDWNTNISMKGPGGGVESTAQDLVLFGKALLNNTLISSSSFEQMIIDTKMKKEGNPYAMGWFIYEDKDRGKIIGHAGGQAGTTTQMMIMLEKEVVVSVISNTRGQFGKVINMSFDLMQLATTPDVELAGTKKSISLNNSDLDKFTGKYESNGGTILKIYREDNQLISQFGEYPPLKLYTASSNQIFYRDFNAFFDFKWDGNGETAQVGYTQRGVKSELKKLK